MMKNVNVGKLIGISLIALIVLGVGLSAQAGVTMYTDRAAFTAAASGLTNVDFSAAGTTYKDWIGNEGAMPHTGSYGYADPSGVEFVGRINSWPLYRVSTANETETPGFFYNWNSGVSLWSAPAPGWMWATLPETPGGYHAIGCDIMTVDAVTGASGLNMLVGLNMGSAGAAGTGLISVSTLTRPERAFIGFISTDVITKIEFQADSNVVYPAIDNFVFGQAAAVPEPSSLLSLLTGAVALLGIGSRRRR